MNFLALCQRLRQEAGLSGTGPTTVAGQVGEMKRVVDWVAEAYNDIQTARTTWRFLRNDFSFETTAAEQDYTPAEAGITDLADWIKRDIKIYSTASGVNTERWLEYELWNFFKAYYMFGSHRTQTGWPTVITVNPDNNLYLWQIPNDEFTVSGEYYQTADIMTEDADVPIFPARFHMDIVWRGLMFYGAYAGAAEKYTHGNNEHGKKFRELEIDQLDEPSWGEPLA